MATRRPNWSFQPPLGVQVNRNHPLAAGLKAVYLLNDGNAVKLASLIEGKHLCTLNSTAFYRDGRGMAQSFNGSTSYAINSAFDWMLGSSAFTLLTWMKTTTAGGYLISIPLASAGNNGADLFLGTGLIRFDLVTSGGSSLTNSSALTYTDDKWHQVVMTYSSAESLHKGYFDGSEVMSASLTGTVSTDSNELNFGRFGSFGGHATSKIGPTMFWTRKLSATEIRDLYVDPYAVLQSQTPSLAAWLTPSPVAGGGTALFGFIGMGYIPFLVGSVGSGFLLLETGDDLLLESGDKIILE